jgi:transaldolase
MSSLEALSRAGVSIWLDDLSRDRLQNGSLAKLIEDSHVVGVTTNPAIFSAAIAGSTLYKEDILALKDEGLSASEIVTELTTADVRNACDLFQEIFLTSNQIDGRVSIEVDPRLAYNTTDTINQAKQLWAIVNRPNLLIKIPATQDGLPAIEEVIAQGISVNVTLVFSVERYREVMESFIRGLERRVANGLPINDIHSVASFFISRIDTDIDKKLDSSGHSNLRGKAALANARIAYEAYLAVVNSPRWQKLAALGGQMQRPLWASTGVKDPAYDKALYVAQLVAPHCVNTMPEATLDATRSSSIPTDSITSHFAESHSFMSSIKAAGVDFASVVNHLEDDGVAKFEKAWIDLLANVDAVTE